MRKTVFILWRVCLLLCWAARASAQVSYQFDLPGDLAARTNIVTTALPQFQQSGPLYAIAVSNGLLSVSAPVTGVGPLSFQWLFNGAVIANATNDSFFLANAQAANLGSYQLVARNSAGAVTSAVVIVSFDTDQTGLPDAWQIKYFGQLGLDPNAAPDGDGVSLYEDYLDGTNPTNASSNMLRLYLSSTSGGTASVTPLKPKYLFDETVQITATANPGNSFISWSGSITNTNPTVNVVMDFTKTITASFGLPLAQVLDSSSLVWTTGGDRSWFGETNTSFDGVSAAQSGVVLVGQQTWLQTTVATPNLFELSFAWAVSSAAGINFLDFDVNGNTMDAMSGGNGLIVWQSQTYLLPPGNGTNVLTWTYAQDESDNDYGWIDLDTGWLDQVHVTPVVITPGSVVVAAWGNNSNSQTVVPSGLSQVVGLAAGEYHSLALKSNGTVVGWGYDADGEIDVPPAATNVTSIASGWLHCLALRRDGTVVAWGNNANGQTTVPPGLSNVVAVAGGAYHSLALQNNGMVEAWGDDGSGQIDVPAGLSNAVAIAAGGYFSLAIRGDGTVVGWGDGSAGETNVPAGLGQVAAIAAGEYHCLALKSDGTVVAWGDDSYGEVNVPSGLSNVVAIAAGIDYSLALESDGTVVAWGDNNYGQGAVPTVPSELGAFVSIAAGGYHALALLDDGAPFFAHEPLDQTVYSGVSTMFNAGAAGVPTLSYHWRFNGTDIAGATNAVLSLANVQVSNSGTYSVVVSNSLGTVTSSNAILTVVNSEPIITAQPAGLLLISGESGAFSVGAAGSLPLSYQWLFNGTNLPGATSSNLTLLDVTTAQAGPYAAVVTNVYGSATSMAVTLALAKTQPGVTFTTVYAFGTVLDSYGNPLDGSFPYAALVQDTNGSMYGTTYGGGSNGGFGTVFRFTTNGTLTRLYSFGAIQNTNGDALDGANPFAPLVVDANGSLFGTTYGGGSNTNGYGTVFRVTTNGALTSLYSFGAVVDVNGDPLDGANPEAPLLADANGSLYGTTSGGGTNNIYSGTVFQISATGALTSLYSFTGGNDGASPTAGLVQGKDGNFYGTTESGGTNFQGAVFRISTNGALTSLYSFGAIQDTNGDALDGAYPYAPLALGNDGNLYGTTFSGGSNVNGSGTVFRIATDGTLARLYSFGTVLDTNGNALDGANPRGGLVLGNDGNFYGTTSSGGEGDHGTLFQITASGAFSTLYRFSGGDDGASPYGSLVQANDGSFYGTAAYGGTNSQGSIFKFTLAEAPSPPVIQSIAHTNGTLTLVWSTVAGQIYQVQSATNLNRTAWTNIGMSIMAGSSTLSRSDIISNTQRFYRIILLP